MNTNLNQEQPSSNASQVEIQQLRERIKELETSKDSTVDTSAGQEIQTEQESGEPSMSETDQPKMTIPIPADDDVQKPTSISDDQTVVQAVDDEDLSAQIKQLVQIAMTDGLERSINRAIKLKNPYVLDELHDTLIDHLYDQLVRMKKIRSDTQ